MSYLPFLRKITYFQYFTYGEQSEAIFFLYIFCMFLTRYDRFSVYMNILTEENLSKMMCLIVFTMETKIFVILDEMKTIFYAKSGF